MKFKPLDSKLIDSETCIRCGHCCKWTTQTHMRNGIGVEWIDTIVEDNDLVKLVKHNKVDYQGKRAQPFELEIKCSKLIVDEKEGTAKCGIYMNRPTVCSDYNCFDMANKLKRRPEGWNKITNAIKIARGIDVKWENDLTSDPYSKRLKMRIDAKEIF